MDKDEAVAKIRTLQDVVLASLAAPRFHALLLAGFGSTALLLSAIGLYGVLSQFVTQRTHEVGGAYGSGSSRSQVIVLILREGLLLTLAGLGVGIIAALPLMHLLSGMLYEVHPIDPLTFVVVSLFSERSRTRCKLLARPARGQRRCFARPSLRMMGEKALLDKRKAYGSEQRGQGNLSRTGRSSRSTANGRDEILGAPIQETSRRVKTAQKKLSREVDIEDLRRLAERRMPRIVFDYLDGGAETEFTLKENSRAFEAITFNPRQAVPVAHTDLRTSILGCELAFPVILAPIGYTRLIHASGEPAVARAAGAAGVVYVVATFAGYRLEEVKAATSGPAWYQLYLVAGREAAEAAIERARQAGYSALVVTVDTPVAGLRERDVRNGMKELLAGSLLSKLPFLPQLFARPRWLASFLLDGGLPKLENVVLPGRGPLPLVDVSAGLASAAVTWDELRWIRDLWRGPIVIKGILGLEDARRAVDEGAAAIVVSNHGGRQLDGVRASIQALPEVVSAVGGQVAVLMDGGVGRGSDIVKAICLGARGVLIGRAYGYGLGAAGEMGVSRALQILREGMERTLRLLGCPTIAHLEPSLVNYPSDWQVPSAQRSGITGATSDFGNLGRRFS